MLDCYNQTINELCICITTRISSSNCYFVAVDYEENDKK